MSNGFLLQTRNDGHRGGFTLPELLTVVAMIGVLLALVAPAFQNLLQNSRRTAAIDGVMALLERARSVALASGQNAYLVFSDHTDVPERSFRAAAVFVDADDFSGPSVAIGPWRELPVGVSFYRDAGMESVLTAPPESQPATFLLPGASAPSTLPYVKFGPTGSVLHPSSSSLARLFIFNGFVAPDGAPNATARRGSPPEQIALSLFTGRATYQPFP